MQTILKLLRERFGFDGFRPGQEAVVERLLAGRSVAAIFPTGGGKSLCYQLPALAFEGLTLVVSPLIALMKDQLDFLARHGVPAARLDSTLAPSESHRVLDEVRTGRLKLLYVAPERFASERFVDRMRRARISLLAIDEAHCISEWGHNFRPDYLKLAALSRELRVERVLALTATATPDVADDIARSFAIDAADVVRTDFHRPNLFLRAIPTTAKARDAELLARLREPPGGPAIVYVTLQRTAEEVAALLADAGLPARAYHAGLDADERHEVQDRFMSSADGVVVATIAFGMGVDKSDIRSVRHYNLPKSLESYAQEIGRAGRDGAPATCELFACPDDVITLENFSCGDTPTRESLAALVDEVFAGSAPRIALSPYELSVRHDIRPLVLDTVLTYLEMEGLLASLGPYYAEYKLKLPPSHAKLLAPLPPETRHLLSGLIDRGSRGRTWTTVDVESAAEALEVPRERLVAALGELEERAAVEVKTAGLRLAYRRGAAPPAREVLVDTLHRRFEDRERRDVARIAGVLELATSPGCLTDKLLRHFGESIGPCGHCAPCNGEPLPPPPAPSTRHAEPAERDRRVASEVAAESHPALRAPRQLTRFLCGLPSPAASRAGLSRDARYGALAHLRFAAVLALSEQALTPAGGTTEAQRTPRRTERGVRRP